MDDLPEEYRGNGEFHFLKMMAREIEKAEYPPGSTFRRESMLNVFRKFRILFGPIYSDRYLKMKIKSLKKKYQEFSELLNQENIFWNKQNNIVYGNDQLLNERYRARYRNGVFIGERNYDLMRDVYDSGINFA
ncbi:CCR4-NOT transcription complex subunit 7 [Striga asiatica]|uniref:CCR4-NOT transcription complex subunit 7 n=1 Tax=Striga asiatica TaxID=4170 RepID=A0A5A7RA87_STRAF|nr:CCR4-NOT transcription complex subunit 7 [Striga asiatica]